MGEGHVEDRAGAADDIRAIEIGPRLLLQAVAVGIVIFTMPVNLSVLPFLPWWLERVLLVVGVRGLGGLRH